MERREVARNKQVVKVGTEHLYERLNQKFLNLDIDPFFYNQQIYMHRVRREFHKTYLKPNIHYRDMEEFTLLSTQCFDQVLRIIESNPEDIPSPFGISIERKSEANIKFLVPSNMFYYTNCLIHSNSYCNPEKALEKLKKLITMYPEAVPLTVQLVQNKTFHTFKMRSLKEICMVAVLKLGLPLDTLPQSLQRDLDGSPEPFPSCDSLWPFNSFHKIVREVLADSSGAQWEL